MKLNDIKKLDRCAVENFKSEKINISVFLVYRGNFNDERLVESRSIPISEIADKPLVWLDAYLGVKADSRKRIALAYLKKQSIYLLEDSGGEITAVKKELFSCAYTDDYDEKYIIATHIY